MVTEKAANAAACVIIERYRQSSSDSCLSTMRSYPVITSEDTVTILRLRFLGATYDELFVKFPGYTKASIRRALKGAPKYRQGAALMSDYVNKEELGAALLNHLESVPLDALLNGVHIVPKSTLAFDVRNQPDPNRENYFNWLLVKRPEWIDLDPYEGLEEESFYDRFEFVRLPLAMLSIGVSVDMLAPVVQE